MSNSNNGRNHLKIERAFSISLFLQYVYMATVSSGNASTNPATQPLAPIKRDSIAMVSTPHKILNLSPKRLIILVTLVISRVDSLTALIFLNFSK